MNNNEKINILVVDDRPENLVVMEGILEEPTLNIIKANSGAEALGCLLDLDIAIVLLDVQMPEMDGFETAELMKKSELTKDIPIIFVTAINYEKKSIVRGYDVGAVDYLFKPIDPIILKSKVNVFVNLYRQSVTIRKQALMLEEKITELIELKETNWMLENLSLMDELTGIPNRRNFNQYLNIQWANCAFAKSHLSLIMIDIDNFKAYNDNYGHLMGDECLVLVAKTIMETSQRPLDLAFRYGGEEFTVLLPNTDLDGSLLIAEKIRKNIEGLEINHEHSKIAKVVTVSLGVATILPDYLFLFHKFIENADECLYKAKSDGRNKIIGEIFNFIK